MFPVPWKISEKYFLRFYLSMIRNSHGLQTLDILARILDPGKEMKSKVSYFLWHVLKTCKFLLTNPMMMYSSFMKDQLMDQRRD